jgi:hypothetical protein
MNIRVMLLGPVWSTFRGRRLPRVTTPGGITALNPTTIIAEDTLDGYVRMSRMTWNRLERLFGGPPKADMSVWDY